MQIIYKLLQLLKPQQLLPTPNLQRAHNDDGSAPPVSM